MATSAWQPVDCHAHTTLSDGDLTVAELAERARSLGVRPSVSDHISRAMPRGVKSVEGIREYLDVLECHDVLRAGEFCWHDALWREIPDELGRRFTHRIGSLHAIVLGSGDVVHAFSTRVPAELTVGAYLDAFLDNAQRLAIEMPVDVLAHPTLVSCRLRHLDPDQLWTEAREERLIDALLGAGIAFELSTRYPAHERIVRRAVARGVRLALGSDAHAAEHVGDVAQPLALARALGVPDAELYDPTRHGSRTSDSASARSRAH